MPHPAVLFSCFCSLCILYLKNIRTGRSILVNDISDGLQQQFVQRIAIFLLFFASHKNVGHMILLQQAQHFLKGEPVKKGGEHAAKASAKSSQPDAKKTTERSNETSSKNAGKSVK